MDNGSVDDSLKRLKAEAPWARVIANRHNRGLPAANNQGIAAAAGDVLLICNPDVVFAAHSLAAMLNVLDRHPRAAFVVPRLRYDDGSLATSAGDLPTLAETLLGRQAQRHRAAGETVGMWWDGWAHDEERVIGRGHEAAYLVRRAALAEFGLQDERFRLDWEGPDWVARARDAGWETWLCPDAEVTHLGGASIRQVPLRWVIGTHLGMFRYFSKRRPVWQRPLLAAAFGLRGALKLVATVGGMGMYERGHRGRAARR